MPRRLSANTRPDKRRGFFASFLDMGSYIGFAIGAALVSVLQLTLGQAAMEDWGWRLPFLIAGPLGLIAVYFRTKIEESPQFQATLDAQGGSSRNLPRPADEDTSSGPVTLVKAYWRQIILAMILAAAANTVGYALTSYMPTYLTESKGYDPVHGTLLTIPVLVIMAACIPLTGKLSDKIGRRPVLWIGAISTVVLAIPAFMLISIGDDLVHARRPGLDRLPRHVLRVQPGLVTAGVVPDVQPLRRHGDLRTTSRWPSLAAPRRSLWQGLINLTGNDMMPAYYLMLTSAIGAVAIYFLRESAQKPLPGSMPSVDTMAEARDLVATQDENPLLDMDHMPFDDSYEPATPGAGIPVTVGRPESASQPDPASELEPVS